MMYEDVVLFIGLISGYLLILWLMYKFIMLQIRALQREKD
jgi:hypothetical protein